MLKDLSEYPDILSTEEMCEYLRISVTTGYKLLRKKEIESIKVGTTYKIPKSSLRKYLRLE